MKLEELHCKNCSCIDAILSVGRDIVSEKSIETIIETCYKKINVIIDVPLLAVGIFNSDNARLDFYGKNSLESDILRGSIPISDSNVWSVRCFLNSEEVLFNSLSEKSNMKFSKILFSVDDNDRKSFIYIPLISKGKKIGVVTFQSYSQDAFKLFHVNVLRSIANYISIAIENAQYVSELNYQKLEMQSIIENMEDIIELRTEEVYLQKNILEKQALELRTINSELEILSIVAKKTENAIMIMDHTGKILWINDYFTSIYGYSLDAFIKHRGKNIKETSFNPNIEQDFKVCIDTKKAVYYEAVNIKENGEPIWTHTSLTPILNNNKEITQLVTIDSDITEIKKAEQSIFEKSNQIQSSIEYASKIQRAAFPSLESILKIVPNCFIFWKPLNVVSGDFYWIKKKHNYTFIVMGDCTGHGVPGALLTMLGCSLMEQIISNYNKESSGEVLAKLNTLFEQRFRHWVMGTEVFDGMDVAICIYNSESNMLQFSGANQDLLVIDNNIINQHKGDRICIGCIETQDFQYKTKEIEVNSGQMYYLFSDGFSSQFGGPNGKKYMKKRLIEFLHSLYTFPLLSHKQLIKNELKNWKGDTYSQTDDILILGFTIGNE